MFTPLVQGKESRIIEDRTIVPGRFRAHAAARLAPASPFASSSNNASAASSASNGRHPFSLRAASSSSGGGGRSTALLTPTKRRRRLSTRRDLSSNNKTQQQVNERTWLLRPSRDRVESWLDAWWKRWLVLVIVPSLIVWTWCAIPFPVSDPYDPNLPWPDPGWNWSFPLLRHAPSKAPLTSHSTILLRLDNVQASASPPTSTFGILEESPYSGVEPSLASTPSPSISPSPRPDLPADLPVDINFWFFLFIYYGAYLAVALIWVTCLFNLYRLNWWPRKLGGRISYFCFWAGALIVGSLIHYYDIFGIQKYRRNRGGGGGHGRNKDDGNVYDWERKTFWVSLAFATMAMPAIVCFGKLRRDRRMTYRHSLTEHQRTFLEIQLGRRIPKSYIRFLWFVACISIALFSGLAGQAYLSVYLSTLPHGSVESVVYVWTWIISCGLFGNLTGWILEKKVGSKALDFVFRLYFQLVYHVFYRTLFARLRKAEQFLYIQLLSSLWIITFYPAWMSRTAYRLFKWLFGAERTYAEHAESVAMNLYVRNLSENVTMVAFLGWLTILHFGPNREVYPFFDFSEKDPYNYRRTAISSLIIWFFELLSSFFARLICNLAFKVDITNTGLDTLRDYPELLPACVWASVHVCMDILLFLVTYNFR